MRKLFVLLVAGAFLLGFTVPALAESNFDFFGTVRVGTFMHDVSKEASPTGVNSDDDAVWTWDRSIFGVNVEAGDITGKFAYWQMYADSLMGKLPFASGEAVEFWGSWNFGSGSLLIGRNWAPVNVFISNQVAFRDLDLLLSGACFTDSRNQIKLTFGGLSLAAIEPEQGGVTGTVIPGLADVDTSMPKLEARYDFTLGPVGLNIMGGINSYDETIATATTERDYGVDSYVLCVVANIPLGAANIAVSAYTGENLANYGVLHWGNASAYWDGTNVKDNDTTGYILVLKYKASDMLTFEAGYGFTESEIDMAGTWEDETSSWYINAVIALAEGVTITPEVGVLDFEDVQTGGATSMKQGDNTYWGAKWQIDF